MSYNIKKELDTKPFHNDKYIKSKGRSSNGKINTNFHDSGMPEDSSSCICFSIILIGFVFEADKNYYPQVFLEECKCLIKEKAIERYFDSNYELMASSAEKTWTNLFQKYFIQWRMDLRKC